MQKMYLSLNRFNIMLILVTTSFFAWDIFLISIQTYILIGLACVVIANSELQSVSNREKLVLSLLTIYVFGGVITYLVAMPNITTKYYRVVPLITSCITPLCLMLCLFYVISSTDQINTVIEISIISLLGFFILVVAGFYFEFAYSLPVIYGSENYGQITIDLKLGGIEFLTYATWIGAIVAMIFPVILIKYFTCKNVKAQLYYFMLLSVCAYTYSQAMTRAGMLAIMAGGAMVCLFIFFKKIETSMIGSKIALVACASIAVSTYITFQIPENVIQKFYSLFYEGIYSSNINYRWWLFKNAYIYSFSNITGVGFDNMSNYLGYLLDEVNFFAWSANGVGAIGIIAFWLLSIVIFVTFLKGLKAHDPKVRTHAIIGLCTLVSTYIAANGNDKILYMPQSVFPFWCIIGACFKSLQLFARRHQLSDTFSED